jgi:DNA-binding IclR family transcriptional regulator
VHRKPTVKQPQPGPDAHPWGAIVREEACGQQIEHCQQSPCHRQRRTERDHHGRDKNNRLGPAALSLGISAIQQIDGFEIVRREVTNLRDMTRRSAAVTTWTDDGPNSLFKQDGDQRGAFEFRTGLIPMLTSAAGKIYAARLAANLTAPLIEQEWDAAFGGKVDIGKFREDATRELKRRGYTTIARSDLSGYVSIAAPVLDWNGDLRFTLSLAGTRASMKTEPTGDQVKSLLASASRATRALGGRTEGRD